MKKGFTDLKMSTTKIHPSTPEEAYTNVEDFIEQQIIYEKRFFNEFIV